MNRKYATFDKTINYTTYYLQEKLKHNTIQTEFVSNIMRLNYNLIKTGFKKDYGIKRFR